MINPLVTPPVEAELRSRECDSAFLFRRFVQSPINSTKRCADFSHV